MLQLNSTFLSAKISLIRTAVVLLGRRVDGRRCSAGIATVLVVAVSRTVIRLLVAATVSTESAMSPAGTTVRVKSGTTATTGGYTSAKRVRGFHSNVKRDDLREDEEEKKGADDNGAEEDPTAVRAPGAVGTVVVVAIIDAVAAEREKGQYVVSMSLGGDAKG